uniref:Ubiquinol-cytochrome c chaperone domain-containing protein n=1 Tax=Strigamia maritima TaxID=126957 RepID=T1IR51_STRMM
MSLQLPLAGATALAFLNGCTLIISHAVFSCVGLICLVKKVMSSQMLVYLLRRVNCVGTIAARTQQFKNGTTKFLSTSSSLQGMTNRLLIEPSWWRRFLKTDFIGFYRHKNREFAYRLYVCCSDGVDHQKFFSCAYESIIILITNLFFFALKIADFNMEDTFNSLFLITELHVWMMSARVMQENKLGRQFRNDIVEAMWKDIDRKSKELGPSVVSTRKEQLEDLSEQMQASFFAYDEGLLTNDMVLASALWRRFSNQQMENVQHLETLVNYVRRSMHYLDAVEQDNLLTIGRMKWPPLLEKTGA